MMMMMVHYGDKLEKTGSEDSTIGITQATQNKRWGCKATVTL